MPTGRPQLPQDDDGYPMQTLAPDDTTVATASIAAGNNRTAFPVGAKVVEVAAQDSCRIAFGDSTVDVTVGTRRLLLAGVFVYKLPEGATHFAVTQIAGSSGVVTVTKLV